MKTKTKAQVQANSVKKMANQLGIDLCGIASIDRFDAAPEGFHPTDILPECRSVIVIGLKYLHSSVKCNEPCQYTVVRHQLTLMLENYALQFCQYFEGMGETSVLIPPADPSIIDMKTSKLKGTISLKHAAQNAGLGRIGKNTLLVNQDLGNMFWFAGILTTSELAPDPLVHFEPCPENCRLCFDACPMNVFEDVPEGTIKQMDCWNYAFGDNDGGGWKMRCHKCRSVCPHCFSLQEDLLRK